MGFRAMDLYLVMVCMGVVGLAGAAEGPSRLVVQRGGVDCVQADLVALGEASLCVRGGSFSHDLYELKLSGKVALSGIDDETTVGLEADSDGRRLRLACEPQLQPNETMKRVVKQSLLGQGRSEEASEALANRMGMIETGRACTLVADGDVAWQVAVVFP